MTKRIRSKYRPRTGITTAFVAVMILAGCATDDPQYVERPVEELYNEAIDAVEVNQFNVAADLFLEVERQHPYSIWATKAQLMSAYSYYSVGQYDDAILASDRFIQLHPGNRDIAYAYYLKALSYYSQITDVGRDQRSTEQALFSLDEILRRFPDSTYARDARLKLDLTDPFWVLRETIRMCGIVPAEVNESNRPAVHSREFTGDIDQAFVDVPPSYVHPRLTTDVEVEQ